jgi:hypothetical protein
MTHYEAVELEVLAGDAPESWEPWRIARDTKRYGWLPVELVDAEVQRRGERRYNGHVLAND